VGGEKKVMLVKQEFIDPGIMMDMLMRRWDYGEG
jgi:hypothetical protein